MVTSYTHPETKLMYPLLDQAVTAIYRAVCSKPTGKRNDKDEREGFTMDCHIVDNLMVCIEMRVLVTFRDEESEEE